MQMCVHQHGWGLQVSDGGVGGREREAWEAEAVDYVRGVQQLATLRCYVNNECIDECKKRIAANALHVFHRCCCLLLPLHCVGQHIICCLPTVGLQVQWALGGSVQCGLQLWGLLEVCGTGGWVAAAACLCGRH